MKSQEIGATSTLMDTKYADLLPGLGTSLKRVLYDNCVPWVAKLILNSGTLRGCALYWYGRQFEKILTSCDAPGSWILLTLEAWFGRNRPRIILLEFIRRQPSGWRKLVYPVWFKVIAKPAVVRAMLRAQVLTSWEREYYASMFGMPSEHFWFVPWPLCSDADPWNPSPTCSGNIVMSSGRVACDWETLFRAAAEQNWELVVVCRSRDLPRLRRLNRDNRAKVFSDIPYSEYRSLLKRATVFVMSMQETFASTGQARFADAVKLGVPTVATRIKGLEGYVEDGKTALLVPPGDWAALRDAINKLLAEREFRDRLGTEAFKRAGAWTEEQYYQKLGLLTNNLDGSEIGNAVSARRQRKVTTR